MDPVCGTVGLVAGVGSIISIVGKSVQTLTSLRQKYKEAELNITLLTGHLRTVRMALFQVQTWATECLPGESQHHQLTVDLEDAVSHCRLLVEYIDNQISKFDWDNDEELGVGSKVLYLLEDQATKDCLNRLDHQINALNLCLTAFKCRTPNEQKRLLERDESRDVFSRARDDATSLIVFRDSASFATSRARTSVDTQFSKTFDFDGLLLKHKIYQNSFRSMLRRAVSPTESRTEAKGGRRALSDTPVFQLKSNSRDSAKIDSKLKKDARRLSKEIKILAVGDKHGRSAIVKQLRHRYGHPFSDTEVEYYRQTITSLVVKALVAVLDYEKETGAGLVSQGSRDHAQLIREFAESGGPAWRVPVEITLAVKHIWHNWHVIQAFSVMQQHGQTAYFLNAIERICQPDYVPTNMDIIRAPEVIDTMKETELVMNTTTVRVIEIREQCTTKIFPLFADIQFCLFAIDLTCYDRYLDDGKGRTNELRDRFSFLKGISRSSYFAKTIILLVLTNAAAFERQIAVSPLNSHFEDYTGANDVHAATKYVLKRCKRANQMDLPLFWHIYDCSEPGSQAIDEFFQQSAASISAVSWVIGLGI
ncbi:uncharacterized protein Z518_08206 [Rhinocladiella mackenziei CBS 650.93]|uniref:Uncharacterized protein n=1 Tax=Rhinocladiella mackenziei CBS 650.93 TaxID=1442369 RepID=A0A0D2FJW7_9EURO|nr:uncharacterized protein Z518_08206 [Rhinocladiella mackenziei CBS 650.93]KIX02267.1 hypothetical protein Z518_08206 [Rhinocladiella mackenziei CBS 650.93]